MYGPHVSFRLSDVPEIHPLEAQLLFDQGIMQEFNFNGVESRRNFEQVVKLSPDCALCWWGLARSYSSNLGRAIENYTVFNAVADRALEKLKAEDGPKVHKMVKSMQLLKCTDAVMPHGRSVTGEVNTSRHAFAAFLCQNLTADVDLSSLCADALMATSPVDYYNGANLKPSFNQAWDILRSNVSPDHAPHPLALHLFIHLTDPAMQRLDNRLMGQVAADALDDMIPGAGHLQHMAAHIYQQVGRFAAGMEASKRALEDNEAYLRNCLTPYSMGHNLQVGVDNAINSGHHGVATAFATRLVLLADDEARIHAKDTSSGSEHPNPFNAHLALVHLRFGFWKEAVEAAQFDGPCGKNCQEQTRFLNGSSWSRAHNMMKQMVLAFANEARGESSNAQSLKVGPPPLEVPSTSVGEWGGKNQNRKLQIATLAMKVELAARRAFTQGNVSYTVDALRKLSQFLDAQAYFEPDPWYYNPRECLGYILLTHGENGAPDPAGALSEFTAALQRSPRNPWALLGAAQASAALNGSELASNTYELQFEAATRTGDTKISSPCPQYGSVVPPMTHGHLRR